MVKKGSKLPYHPRENTIEMIDNVRNSFKQIKESKLYDGLKNGWGREKAGMGRDLKSYFESCEVAAEIVNDNPDILDTYAIDIESGYDRIKNGNVVMDQVQTIIYFRANPWLVAEQIIGMDNLNKATVLAARFTSFTPFQKKFLRDALDPRVNNMIFVACRSAGKTWLTSLAMEIMEYLMPQGNVMVTSGSQEQSDNLYRYFAGMVPGTRFEDFIEKQTLTKTETKAGGWIRAFPASHKSVHGPRPDVVIVDEACKADSDIIMAAMSAAMSAQSPKFIVMTTPDKMVHIVRKWWLEAEEQERMTKVELSHVPKQARWKKYHLTAFDCKWIKQEAIDNLTYKYGGRNTHEYKIYVLGQFAPAEGLVFSEELITASLIDALPTHVNMDVELEDGSIQTVEETAVFSFYTTGLDAGGKHPSAVITACEDQVGNVYIILDKEVQARTGDDPIVVETYKQASENWSHVYADAAPVQYFLNKKIRAKLQEDNLPGLTVIPFHNNKLPMISAIRGLLEANMLFILGNPGGPCERLVNQLLTYSYDDKIDSEMPMKGNDDHVDAMLLACWPHRNTFLNRKYAKAAGKIYNMNDVLEETSEEVTFDNPFIRTGGIQER